MASVKEGVIRMFNGRMVDVFNLQPEDVIPINFIHALSLINRFTGASPWPVSVQQHSLKIEEYIAGNYNWSTLALDAENATADWYQFRRAGFIHDWSEALFNDLASPVKKNFIGYKQHEHRAQKVIFEAMGVPMEYLERVDPIDKQIYRDEVRSTWGIQKDSYDTDRRGLGVTYTEQPWREVRLAAYHRYNELFPDGPYIGAIIL